MSRRVAVHHLVANLTTRQYGPNPTSDLLGVDYWHGVPPDTEFPHTLRQMDLFTRFYPMRARPTEYRVRVFWLDHPSGTPQVIGIFWPYRVAFRRTDIARDAVFRLNMIQLRGVGRHSVELLQTVTRGLRAGELLPVATTHFLVER